MQLESCHTRVGLGLAAILLATPALAVLRDRGPVDPATGYPVWYRDAGSAGVPSLALQMCLSDNQSPNVVGAFMCLTSPVGSLANPAGFAGNWGDEAFYAVADSNVSGVGLTGILVTALEAAYGTGTPVKGQEMVFARIRIRVSTPVAGTYTVTHPFGVEIFPDVGVGTNAINFTSDVGITPLAFDVALGGQVGPFVRWDALAVGESLIAQNPATGLNEEFIGDPSIPHTVTGSPFGTNVFRIDGPPGSGIGGPGLDFVESNLFLVSGKKYLTPIPTPLKVQRATYSRSATNSSVDVFATANPGQQLIVSGAGLTPATAVSSGENYLSHSLLAVDALLPATVDVTNATDVPPFVVTARVTDLVTISDAAYDPATSTLTIAANSSDAAGGTAVPPALVLSGYGTLAAGTFTTVIGPVPPESVTVTSSAGGSATRPVRLALTAAAGGGTLNVAANDTATTDFNVPVVIDVTGNDTIASGIAAIVITAPPQHGSAVAGTGAALGTVTYTPAPNYSGPDSFTYVIQDALGFLSNVASVSVNVVFVPFPPVANNDLITTTAGVANTFAILANDTAAVGTAIVPGTVDLNPAVAGRQTTVTVAAGTLTWSDATQLVTFTPAAGFTGAGSATYTVQNNALPTPQTSNVATINLQVNAAAEVINITRAQFRTGTSRWTVTGTSTVATGTVTIYNGSTTAASVIGTAPIVAGAFAFDLVGGPPPSASRLILIRSSNGGQRIAAVTVRL